jgi:hypothetical protein
MLHVVNVITFCFLLHACTPAPPDATSLQRWFDIFVEEARGGATLGRAWAAAPARFGIAQVPFSGKIRSSAAP